MAVRLSRLRSPRAMHPPSELKVVRIAHSVTWQDALLARCVVPPRTLHALYLIIKDAPLVLRLGVADKDPNCIA